MRRSATKLWGGHVDWIGHNVGIQGRSQETEDLKSGPCPENGGGAFPV